MERIFAVPTVDKKLTAHFGHCQSFAVIKVEDDKIVEEVFLDPPEHIPGSYPSFLASQGVETIIAGGMGVRAQDLFKEKNIEVFMGLEAEEPSRLVELYLADKLENGANLCDSDHEHGDCKH